MPGNNSMEDNLPTNESSGPGSSPTPTQNNSNDPQAKPISVYNPKQRVAKYGQKSPGPHVEIHDSFCRLDDNVSRAFVLWEVASVPNATSTPKVLGYVSYARIFRPAKPFSEADMDKWEMSDEEVLHLKPKSQPELEVRPESSSGSEKEWEMVNLEESRLQANGSEQDRAEEPVAPPPVLDLPSPNPKLKQLNVTHAMKEEMEPERFLSSILWSHVSKKASEYPTATPGVPPVIVFKKPEPSRLKLLETSGFDYSNAQRELFHNNTKNKLHDEHGQFSDGRKAVWSAAEVEDEKKHVLLVPTEVPGSRDRVAAAADLGMRQGGWISV